MLESLDSWVLEGLINVVRQSVDREAVDFARVRLDESGESEHGKFLQEAARLISSIRNLTSPLRIW